MRAVRAKSILDRFWKNVERTDSCWFWQGHKTAGGYGRIAAGGRSGAGGTKYLMVHRFAYELHHCKQIPIGLVIDHICRTRNCVNPQHLRAVTQRVNALENSDCPAAQRKKWTHCSKGHLLDGENLMLRKNGNRTCRDCHRRWSRETNQRKKIKDAANNTRTK